MALDRRQARVDALGRRNQAVRSAVTFALLIFGFLPFPLTAGLDDDFEGDILLVGGKFKGDPNCLTLNLKGAGDLAGSGWDVRFLKQLSSAKYRRIILDHQGFGLSERVHVKNITTVYEVPKLDLAQEWARLLQPGGRLDLLSSTAFLEEWDASFADLFNCFKVLNLKFRYDCCKRILSWDHHNSLRVLKLSQEIDGQNTMSTARRVHKAFSQNTLLMKSLDCLARAGMTDLCVMPEKQDILPGLVYRGSLHISAMKGFSLAEPTDDADTEEEDNCEDDEKS